MTKKEKIHQTCLQLVQDRIDAAFKAMADAQNAANGEDKSSAGDKFETSRSMGQLDRNMYAAQAAQAKAEYEKLYKMNPSVAYDQVIQGCLVQTEAALFYVAVGLGNIQVDGETVVVLSAAAPIAQAMWGKKQGDAFQLNGKTFQIKNIT